MTCDAAARLGQELFFEPALATSFVNRQPVRYGTVACVTCHDPKAYFIDSRSPNNVSQKAAGWTKRNVPTMVDVATKYQARTGPLAFSWVGQFEDPGEVLDIAAGKAMDVSHPDLVETVTRSSYYSARIMEVLPGTTGIASDCSTPEHPEDPLYCKLTTLFEAYLFRLNTTTDFDRYMLGDDGALTDEEKLGFGVFVGRGTCVECHQGPALTDYAVHVTGVAQSTADPSKIDHGRMDASHDQADDGAFMTASLRNVARTGPYMHRGSLMTLADVIAFYRRGGDPTGYPGTKDPRIVPLDLTDDDARNLEAFLDALTGGAVDVRLQNDVRPLKCAPGLTNCAMVCQSLETDPTSCGQCGHFCGPGQACMDGMCVDAMGCPMPQASCYGQCVDQASDPRNCGGCGVTCSLGQVCSYGHCTISICPTGTTSCGDQCTDLSNDIYNCGACGSPCMGRCQAGSCVP